MAAFLDLVLNMLKIVLLREFFCSIIAATLSTFEIVKLLVPFIYTATMGPIASFH